MTNTKRRKWLIIKLSLTVCLFGLSWVYRPAQAASDCPAGATLNAVCVTINECGDQSCDADLHKLINANAVLRSIGFTMIESLNLTPSAAVAAGLQIEETND